MRRLTFARIGGFAFPFRRSSISALAADHSSRSARRITGSTIIVIFFASV
jgi:hypothetical protein